MLLQLLWEDLRVWHHKKRDFCTTCSSTLFTKHRKILKGIFWMLSSYLDQNCRNEILLHRPLWCWCTRPLFCGKQGNCCLGLNNSLLKNAKALNHLTTCVLLFLHRNLLTNMDFITVTCRDCCSCHNYGVSKICTFWVTGWCSLLDWSLITDMTTDNSLLIRW